MSSYITYLETIDLFGYPVHFNVGKQHVYTSIVGGFSTLMTIMIVLYVNWSSIVLFFSKETLVYSQQTQYDMDPSLIHLNQDNFMIALAIEQPDYNTSPFFNISIEQRWYERFENGTQIKRGEQIQLAACEYEQFQRVFNLTGYNFTDTYNKLNLKTWLCPTEVNFTLRGIFQSSYFDLLKITVNKCKNDTSNIWKPKCASQSTIDAYLSQQGSFKVQIYTTNTIINPNKAADYVQQYFDDEMYFTFTPNKLSRQGNIYLRKYEFQNDESLWPWSQIQETVFISRKPEDFRDLTELGNATDDVFAVFFIRRSPLTERITRSYQKINNLLGQIGGFVQIMLIAIGIFITYFNKQAFLHQLANQLFEFNYQENDEKNRKQSINLELLQTQQAAHHRKDSGDGKNILNEPQSPIDQAQCNIAMPDQADDQVQPSNQVQPEEQLQHDEIIEVNEVDNVIAEHQSQAKVLNAVDGSDYFSKYLNRLHNNKGVLILTAKSILNIISCGFCFSKNKESIVLRKAINNIDKQLDIYRILEKLNEIDKLKEILFDKNYDIRFHSKTNNICSQEETMQQRQIIEEYDKSKNQKSQIKEVNNKTEQQFITCNINVKAYLQSLRQYNQKLKFTQGYQQGTHSTARP